MTLVWRPLTDADSSAWHRLLATVEGIDLVTVSAEMRTDLLRWSDEHLFDRGSIAAFDGRQMIAYGIAMPEPYPVEVHRIRLDVAVHPHCGADVGPRLLDRLLWRAVQVHHHLYPLLELEVHCDVHDDDAHGTAVLVQAGFRAARRYWSMCRHRRLAPQAPVPPPVPSGLTLISYDRRYDESVRRANNDACAGGWSGTRHTPESWCAWRILNVGPGNYRYRDSFLLIDERTDEVAAFLLSRQLGFDVLPGVPFWRHRHPYLHVNGGFPDQWITAIVTRPDWRGRGAATALLSAALQMPCRVVLNVDAAHGLELAARFDLDVTDRWTTYVLAVPQTAPGREPAAARA
jgi:mycothiol synthase